MANISVFGWGYIAEHLEHTSWIKRLAMSERIGPVEAVTS